MVQTINCIRMGEVLFDENMHLFILCKNCHSDLRNLHDFRQHLEKCNGLENLFQEGQVFKFNTDKSTQLFGKTFKGIKEFIIYDYNDVEVTYNKTDDNFIDMINIEEELLDPKWYSDLSTETSSNTTTTKTSKQYDELVEAVTPFVQFKENLKSNNNSASHSVKSCLTKARTELKLNSKAEKTMKSVQFELNCTKTKPAAKRKLSLAGTESIMITAPTVNTQKTITPVLSAGKTYAYKRRKTEQVVTNGIVKSPEIIKQIYISTPTATKTNINPSSIRSLTNSTSSTATTSSVSNNAVVSPMAACKITLPTTIAKKEQPIKEKQQTAQILSKLQNLGLQVKRTHSVSTSNSVPAPNKADSKTLEILQKLQSKGMKVKILNKQQQFTDANNIDSKPSPAGTLLNPLQKTISVIRNPVVETVAIKQNLNKNLIIRKVN